MSEPLVPTLSYFNDVSESLVPTLSGHKEFHLIMTVFVEDALLPATLSSARQWLLENTWLFLVKLSPAQELVRIFNLILASVETSQAATPLLTETSAAFGLQSK